MTNAHLAELLAGLVQNLDGEPGYWQFEFQEVPMLLMTDEGHDRMRIISPAGDSTDLPEAELLAMLSANFKSALDARYCIYEGRIWSAFIHPLSSLARADLSSALEQVGNLVRNYGGTYASLDLRFSED